MDIHIIKFCFSDSWKAPILPFLNIDEDFIKNRQLELKHCFSELNKIIKNIDSSTNKGFSELIIAKNVSYELRSYNFMLKNLTLKNKYKESAIPYTASNKKRLGIT